LYLVANAGKPANLSRVAANARKPANLSRVVAASGRNGLIYLLHGQKQKRNR
jgi:hypothetical protein